MSTVDARTLRVVADDGHAFDLIARIPDHPQRVLLWLPALGVAAKHYVPLADALAQRDVAVYVHEWRGNGSSSLRPDRVHDWGYRELLLSDLPASEAAIRAAWPDAARVIGGHSLGGQLACCRLAIDRDWGTSLWLAASGAPYWRAFPSPTCWTLPLVYRFLPWLADRAGRLPGRRIGFGGNEARGLIRDWARTAISGRYTVQSMEPDLESALQAVDADIVAVVLDRDWLAPESSLHFLRSKMPRSRMRATLLDTAALGVVADHFAWMAQPDRVAAILCGQAAADTGVSIDEGGSASSVSP